MANAVAKLLVELEPPIMMTCANEAAIPKGTILQLADPMTVSASSAADEVFGGIAAEEKIANDGKTKIAVYARGIFACEAGANVTVGKQQVLFGLNELEDFDTLDEENGRVCGRALETATNGEIFACYITF